MFSSALVNLYTDDIEAALRFYRDLLGGEETFRELRGLQSDVRVILMSGYTEQEVTNRFAGKGLAGFLQKPFTPIDLFNLVRRVLDR